jgi:uncharacterized protein with PhoU and TrkA domain
MMSARNQEDAEDLVAMIHIAHAAENMSDSAKNIVEVVLRGEGDHPILRGMVSEAEETITKVKVNPSSILCNKSLGELQLGTNTGMYVIAIKRGKRWAYRPKKNRRIKDGDLLIAVGPKEGADIIAKLSDGTLKDLE